MMFLTTVLILGPLFLMRMPPPLFAIALFIVFVAGYELYIRNRKDINEI
jgi:hypothetical protein